MSLTNTFAPTSGWTTPVYPVFNDQTHLFNSTRINRAGYITLSDVYMDDAFKGRLKTYPFNERIEVNPTKLSSNYIGNDTDEYINVNRCKVDTEALQKLYMVSRDSYARYVNFSAITNTNGYVTLNFIDSTDLQVGDRVYIEKDNSSVNAQYNTYGEVLSLTGNNVTVDLTYSATSLTESGIAWEGSQYFDFSIISGQSAISTVNPHGFNVGDSIYIQMDTWAVGVVDFLINIGTPTITSFKTAGIDLITGTIPFNTDIPTTVQDIANNINSTIQSPKFTAYHYPGSSKLFIYTKRDNSQDFIGNSFAILYTSGTYGFSLVPFHTSGGYDTQGNGWNPQITGTYTVKDVLSTTAFTINEDFTYYNIEIGAERGSIYSRDRYVSPTGFTGNTYYVLNASNKYDFNDYKTEINSRRSYNINRKFLRYKPKDKYFYSSINDLHTLDILYNSESQLTGTTTIKNLMVFAYSGDNQTLPYTAYQVDVSDILNQYSGSSEFYKVTFGVGSYNLNQINSSFITPTPPAGGMIQDYTTKYQVFAISADTFTIFQPTAVSELITFNKKCNNWSTYQLIFLNRFGSYEYYNVYSNLEATNLIERTSYDSKGEKAYSDTEYGVRNFNRNGNTSSTNVERNVKIWSDWLSNEEANCLSLIYQSPEIYVYVPNPNGIRYNLTLFPAQIIDSEVKTPNERSMLRQFEFNLRLSNKLITQTN